MKINKLYTYSHAFTLVELMISIAIIALMTGIITANFTGSRQQSRDGQRVSDLGQIQLALSLYFDRCGTYATTTAGSIKASDLAAATCKDQQGNDIPFTSYIAKIPVPPSRTSTSYEYASNWVSGSTATDFVLHATFETANNATKNALDSATLPIWFTGISPAPFNCGAPLDYCIGSK